MVVVDDALVRSADSRALGRSYRLGLTALGVRLPSSTSHVEGRDALCKYLDERIPRVDYTAAANVCNSSRRLEQGARHRRCRATRRAIDFVSVADGGNGSSLECDCQQLSVYIRSYSRVSAKTTARAASSGLASW